MSDPNQMSFLEHLEELRWRIIKAVLAIGVAATLAFIFKGIVFDEIILAPKESAFLTYRIFCKVSLFLGLDDSLCVTSNFSLQNIQMSGQFTSHIVVSLVAGLVVSFPYVFYQVWGFIQPGLKSSERQSARGVVFFTTVLFLMGILFGYYLKCRFWNTWKSCAGALLRPCFIGVAASTAFGSVSGQLHS